MSAQLRHAERFQLRPSRAHPLRHPEHVFLLIPYSGDPRAKRRALDEASKMM